MPEEPLDVPACVQRVRQGDEEAARVLMEHLYPLILKLVRAHLPRRTSEEDMVQTVFIKIFTKLEQFSGTVPLHHWVSRIAINSCINQIQKEKVRPEIRYADLTEEQEVVLERLNASDQALEPSQSIAAKELVSKMLEQLSAQDRLLIHLLYLEGHSVEEVRQKTGWNTSVIKVRAFRARHKMRGLLEKLLEETTHEKGN